MFSERDEAKKFAFSHLLLDKMFCPHCGARNKSHIPTKPLKTSRGRWQPKRRSVDTDDYEAPSVIVHEACQHRMTGSIYSPEGLQVICDGCRFVFNCLTGNVDEGKLETDDPDFVAKRQEEKKIEAIQIVAKKQRDDELTYLLQLRKQLGKSNFCYEFKKSMWYCRFGGTCWKLSDTDIEAIRSQKWDTAQTTVIKRSLDNKGIKALMANLLLGCELLVQRRLGA